MKHSKSTRDPWGDLYPLPTAGGRPRVGPSLFRRRTERRQTAYKPGSVRGPTRAHATTIHLGRPLPGASRDRPGRLARERTAHLATGEPPLLGLAPGGVCRAIAVTGDAVRSYRTLSPLPAGHGPKPRRPAVCSLWHCPWGRPRRALPGSVFPWSPDFPPPPEGEGGRPAVWPALPRLRNPQGQSSGSPARARSRLRRWSHSPSQLPSSRSGLKWR